MRKNIITLAALITLSSWIFAAISFAVYMLNDYDIIPEILTLVNVLVGLVAGNIYQKLYNK